RHTQPDGGKGGDPAHRGDVAHVDGHRFAPQGVRIGVGEEMDPFHQDVGGEQGPVPRRAGQHRGVVADAGQEPWTPPLVAAQLLNEAEFAQFLDGSTHARSRLPRFSRGTPARHKGQSSGSQAGASRESKYSTRTPRSSARPPLRSASTATPTTSAPACRATSSTSRTEPPVVTTSSTTRQRSPGWMRNPRRKVNRPSCLSANTARAPSWRAIS